MIFPQTVVNLKVAVDSDQLFTVESFLVLILCLHASQRCRDTVGQNTFTRTEQVFIDVLLYLFFFFPAISF